MPQEEMFKIPKTVKIPPYRRIANMGNARWIIRNVFIHNHQEQALQAKAAVKDWVAKHKLKLGG